MRQPEEDTMSVYGGVEAGGTKFACVIGCSPDKPEAEISFPTSTPRETIDRTIDFFQEYQQRKPLSAIGIGSFGPLDFNPVSSRFGYITATPKPGWANTDIYGRISRALGVPIGFDTDANAAALGEATWGAAKGLDTFVYVTVGTGIGGGGMANGQLLHGLLHPEMGHVRIPHDFGQDPYSGACPFHGDCFEGLAAGPALLGRWGHPAEELPADHPAWRLEAHYLALGLANLICTLSPQRIILGGGVMQQTTLFPVVRRNVQQLLHGYPPAPAILEQIEEYIVPAALGNRAGVLGAIALAKKAAH
jgi:fructokinase